MHFVLVGLDGNAGQGGIAADIIRLAQIPMPRREASLKQLYQIDLAAGFGQGIKILVVDMDIPAPVGLDHLLGDQIRVIKAFGPFGTIFEHGPHSRVGVDIGVFAFHIGFFTGLKGQILIDFHEAFVHVADFGMFRPV